MNKIRQNIYSGYLNNYIKAFPNVRDIELIINNSKSSDGNGNKYTVLTGMEYRPDIISLYYLGDTKYAWAIYYANYSSEGIKFFTLGREIKIPDINALNL
jgi:hypothetical protein